MSDDPAVDETAPHDLLGSQGEGLSGGADAEPERVASLYDGWVNGYDDDVERWGYAVPDRVAEIAVQRGIPSGEVLDAGCGTGLAGQALHTAGVTRLVGADFSANSLEVADRRGVYEELHEVDLNRPLPFDDHRFSAVVSAGVFSYLTDAASVLRELLRVAAPGGQVIFTQRTDLWADRDFDTMLRRLGADLQSAGIELSVTSSEAEPYLPGHVEFGASIGVIYTTLRTGEPHP